MDFQNRSYAGKIFRPKPEVHFSENEKLLTIGTPWGNRAGTRRAVDTLTEYFVANMGDSEATSPFKRLPNLSSVANNLRIGILLANEYIYSSENRDEYKNGAEFFTAAFDQKELVWLQVGNPHVLLKREGKPLLQLSASMDLSMELSTPEKILAPLPGDLLGIDPTPHIVINAFRPGPRDQLILISRSWLPHELFLLSERQFNLEDISMALATADEDQPFWLGIWNL